jgi:hypothetical protein
VIKWSDAMRSALIEIEEDVLTFDIPDDALELAAAATNGRAIIIAYCTQCYDLGGPLEATRRK